MASEAQRATRRKRIEAVFALLCGPLGGDTHARRWSSRKMFGADPRRDLRDYRCIKGTGRSAHYGRGRT